MKYFFLCICIFLFSTLPALPIGNPTDAVLFHQGIWMRGRPTERLWCLGEAIPSCLQLSVKFGYYGDRVFNRHLEIQGDGLGQYKQVRCTEISTDAAYLALNIHDWIDLFGTIGTSSLYMQTNEGSWSIDLRGDGYLWTTTQFSWSAGFRSVLYNWHCFHLGIEGQYFETKPAITEYVSAYSFAMTSFPPNQTRYQEWQLGVLLSYVIQTTSPHIAAVPYLGIKWSQAHFATHNFSFTKPRPGENPIDYIFFDLESAKRIGFAVGTSLVFYDCIGCTIEGRVGDESALFLCGQFCF